MTSALALGSREHVALVGGGGKTSLMFALAEELRLEGRRVLTTTTTKIWFREAQHSPCAIFPDSCSGRDEMVGHSVERYGHVFVGQGLLDSGKVQGISPAIADSLFRDPRVENLILEADGSAGRPVKAHAKHEPAIPASATTVIAMMGLEALGKRLEPEVVFRVELFQNLTGLKRGDRLTPEGLAKVFQTREGLFRGSPDLARRVVFLNKLDLLPGDHEARKLADLIVKGSYISIDRVVIGSIRKASYFLIRSKP